MTNDKSNARLSTDNLAKNLRRLRYENNKTYEEFAEEIEVSTRLVYDYEDGFKKPSLTTLVRIASTYGVSLDSLLS